MATMPRLIVQVPRGGAVHRQLEADPLPSVSGGQVVVEAGPTDVEGVLEPPPAGQVVLSVPSPESLEREADEVRRVIGHAGTSPEPVVVVVEAAEELRGEQLAVVLDAAERASRAVIVRVMRDG
jgi:hypothetical protein